MCRPNLSFPDLKRAVSEAAGVPTAPTVFSQSGLLVCSRAVTVVCLPLRRFDGRGAEAESLLRLLHKGPLTRSHLGVVPPLRTGLQLLLLSCFFFQGAFCDDQSDRQSVGAPGAICRNEVRS
jgi:hypothetical protein